MRLLKNNDRDHRNLIETEFIENLENWNFVLL